MNLISSIPEKIKEILLKDNYFSSVKFIKSYSSNINPNPITRTYISLELESVHVKNLTLPQYLGSSNTDNYFGNYLSATVSLGIYSPLNVGCDGCYDTFFKICEVFSNDNTYIIDDVCCNKIEYDDDTFCFKASCTLNINLFLTKKEAGPGVLSDICVVEN